MNDVNQREWGWILVRIGGFSQTESGRVFRYSEIIGERFSGRTFAKPDANVRWLKNQISKTAYKGVIAENVVHGGSDLYNNIWFTDMAQSTYKDGVIWKQFVTDNVEYRPTAE